MASVRRAAGAGQAMGPLLALNTIRILQSYRRSMQILRYSYLPTAVLSFRYSSGQGARGAGVCSVLGEMASVLGASAHSMGGLDTETREQQRAWWVARVALDVRVAGLLAHLDARWLGPWRCAMHCLLVAQS